MQKMKKSINDVCVFPDGVPVHVAGDMINHLVAKQLNGA